MSVANSVVIIALFFTAILVRGSQQQTTLVLAIPETLSSFDTLTSQGSNAAAERLRPLLFNTLVRTTKDFDYIGELARDITTSSDGRAITFLLRENVRFHDGVLLTSSDVKFTFDTLFESKGYKSFAFFETVKIRRKWKSAALIESIEIPDPHTVIFRLSRPGLKQRILGNLVSIPIIRSGTLTKLNSLPVGTGPFRYLNASLSQRAIELDANPEYWEGVPTISRLQIKTIDEPAELLSQLRSGAVDIAQIPSNSPERFRESVRSTTNIKISTFDGANIQYLGLNTKSFPLNNVKVRQAIGYAIDRDKIINEVLPNVARPAFSILPTNSWAFSVGTPYSFDSVRARKLLREANYKNSPITLKIPSGYSPLGQYALALQRSLQEVGLNIHIDPVEAGTLRMQLAQGDFQMSMGTWIGGNQDPLFLKDLFSTAKIPGVGIPCCNRSRYNNPTVDKLLDQAVNESDRSKAAILYTKVWVVISKDLPLVPLWYFNNAVVSNKRVGNIKMNEVGDLTFLKDLTIN